MITQQSAGGRVFANQPFTLSVSASSDTQDPRIGYRWEHNGLQLPASTPTLSLFGTELSSGIYRARIRNIDGITWSDPVRVEVLYPGSVVQWGAGDAAPPLLTNAVEAAVGGGHVIARLDDGTLLGGETTAGDRQPLRRDCTRFSRWPPVLNTAWP